MWRDKINALFGKHKEPPGKAFEAAAATKRDSKIADHERQLQHRELNTASAATHDDDMNEARAEAGREHPAPKNAPDGAVQPRSKGGIEADAKRIYAARHQAKQSAIDAKPQRQLIEDAATRARREEAKEFMTGTIKNEDVNFMGRVQGGPRLMDNLSNRQIGALIGNVVSDAALWDATVKALKEPLPGWLAINDREGSVTARVAAIEARHQEGQETSSDTSQQKTDRPATPLTEAEKDVLRDAAERGDIAETAEVILATGEGGRNPEEAQARVDESAAIMEAAQSEATPGVDTPGEDTPSEATPDRAARIAALHAADRAAAASYDIDPGRTM